MAIDFKGAHFPPEVILMGIRWYVAYPLSTRHVEELMEERGVEVDHSTINRWVIKDSPQLEAAFHRRKRPVWVSWRMDETSMKVQGEWWYLYRAVDKLKGHRGEERQTPAHAGSDQGSAASTASATASSWANGSSKPGSRGVVYVSCSVMTISVTESAPPRTTVIRRRKRSMIQYSRTPARRYSSRLSI